MASSKRGLEEWRRYVQNQARKAGEQVREALSPAALERRLMLLLRTNPDVIAVRHRTDG